MSADGLLLEVSGFPTAIRPMRPVRAEAPFSSDDYLFEVKWEGIRCLCLVDPAGQVHLHDRSLRNLTPLLPELADLQERVPAGSILDGELVATDTEGRLNRGVLRRRLAAGPAGAGLVPLAYVAFDLLYLRGRPLFRTPLHRRRARLRSSVSLGGHLSVPYHIEQDGDHLFDACLDHGLEGVVAKHRDSTYVPGQATPFWLVVEAVRTDDFVVCGYLGRPTAIQALLLAFYEEGALLPCGTVTGGWDEEAQAVLADRLQRLTTTECPLRPRPLVTAPVHWCRPELVVTVRYSEWAPDGTLRFPIFNALRPDVHPAECVRRRHRAVRQSRPQPGSPAYDLARFPF